MNIFQLFGLTPANSLLSILIFLVCAFAFFIIIREIITWYWKINKIVNLLEKIEKNTSKSSSLNTEETEQQDPQDIPDKDAKTSMFDPRFNVKW